MAILQCPQGHYYDDTRTASCPYCVKLRVHADDDLREQLTSYVDVGDFTGEGTTEAYFDFVDEEDRTIGIFTDEDQNQRTAGWLVCINGLVKGKSYPFFVGRNFAGRSPDMDLVLSDDRKISREKHFSVVFDPVAIDYYLIPGSGTTFLNGKIITQAARIIDGDEIGAGETKYLFVPFCKEGRVWD